MPAVPRPCGLLLPCTCIVCRREARPTGKSGIILPDGHVRSNLTQDIQGGHVCDPYHRYQMTDDTGVFLTVIFQFFIDQPDAFIQLAEMQLDDIQFVALDAYEFIAVDAFKDIFI